MMTIFAKIIAGELPAYKIYEDERVLAFLDIYPKGVGHTLLIPKKAYTYVWNMDEADYQYIMEVAKKLALHLKAKLQTEFVRLDIVGTDVPHAHIHLIPFNLGQEKIEGSSIQLSEVEFQALVNKLKVDQL